MLKENDFTNEAQKKFLALLREANAGTVTDIEIVANDIVRFGLIKKLRLCISRTKFDDPELKEVLNLVQPENRKNTGEDVRKYLPYGFSFSIEDMGHYRVLAISTKHGISLSIRKLPYSIPTLDILGLPENISRTFFDSRDGLFLVTGPTGSGKTTTIASLLEEINKTRFCKIVTIEDPIEYCFLNSKSTFAQLEVGTDITSVKDGTYHVLRSNPEVLFLGEVRSAEEGRACLSAAETGHLVISSYHVPDSVSAIERLINEVGNSDMTRQIIASTLIGVLNQRLFVREDYGDAGEGGNMTESDAPIARFIYVWEFLPIRDKATLKAKVINGKFDEIRALFEDSQRKQRKDLQITGFQDSMDDLLMRGLLTPQMLTERKYYDFTSRLKDENSGVKTATT